VNSSRGNARKMSIVRLMKVSTQPPRNPAITPRVVPMTIATTVARNATSSEMRAPYRMRLKTSRPF
jgi:hypothetical protein